MTGLQCSLELAVASRRRPEGYVRTIREGLNLTERMRVLVEAIRELTDTQPNAEAEETFRFDELLRDTVDNLRPVAAALGPLVEAEPGWRQGGLAMLYHRWRRQKNPSI